MGFSQSKPEFITVNPLPEITLGKGEVVSKKLRKECWKSNFNSTKGKCFCCGKKITQDNWHCGHILARTQGGSTLLHNVKPVCQHCNLSMGRIHMFEYMLNEKKDVREIKHHPLFKYYELKRDLVKMTEEEILRLKNEKKLSAKKAKQYIRALKTQITPEKWQEIVYLIL